MVIYTVTTELKTSWWLKLLRFCRIKKKRQEFEIVLDKEYYKEGDILNNEIKIITINESIQCTGNNGNGCFLDSCGHNCGCDGIISRKKE